VQVTKKGCMLALAVNCEFAAAVSAVDT